jgi:hypothetical protein
MGTAARTTRAGPPYQLDRSANAAVSGDATPRLINLAPASLLATTHHNQTGHTAPGATRDHHRHGRHRRRGDVRRLLGQ